MTGKEIMDEVGQLLEATAGMDLAHPNVMQTYKYGTQESMVSRAALPSGRLFVAFKLARPGLQQAVWQRQLAWSGLQCQEQATMLRASWHHQGCTFTQQARRLQAGMARAAVPGSRLRGGCTLWP